MARGSKLSVVEPGDWRAVGGGRGGEHVAWWHGQDSQIMCVRYWHREPTHATGTCRVLPHACWASLSLGCGGWVTESSIGADRSWAVDEGPIGSRVGLSAYSWVLRTVGGLQASPNPEGSSIHSIHNGRFDQEAAISSEFL